MTQKNGILGESYSNVPNSFILRGLRGKRDGNLDKIWKQLDKIIIFKK